MQFSQKNACECMFPIINYEKNNIKCVLTFSDNTHKDFSIGT
jgi:hypothetical protein